MHHKTSYIYRIHRYIYKYIHIYIHIHTHNHKQKDTIKYIHLSFST